MGWLEDDEMMRQWEDASKEEITVRKMKGWRLQVERGAEGTGASSDSSF